MVEPSMQLMNKLLGGQIRLIKVGSVRTITSFNSNVNDPSMQFMSEVKLPCKLIRSMKVKSIGRAMMTNLILSNNPPSD